MKRVIIDTDPGIDDTAAILFALNSPEIHIEALTTVFGNVSVQKCTVNALRILGGGGQGGHPRLRGRGQAVRTGRTRIRAVHPRRRRAWRLQRPRAVNAVQERNAVIEIIERVQAAPGEIKFIALGRLTNLALAINVEPSIADMLTEVVVMGGAVAVPGNVTPVATANIWGDPQAADVVYRSGAPIAQVGLDVCREVEFSPEQLATTWAADTPATRLLQGAVAFIQQAYNRRGRLRNPRGAQFNDVPAMGYAVAPHLFTTRDAYVRVEHRSEFSNGQTVADFDGQTGEAHNAAVALEVDAPGLTDLWVERVRTL